MGRKKAIYQNDTIEQDDSNDDTQKKVSTSKLNLPPGWTRITLTMKEEHLRKLKDLAYWGRGTQKDALEEILEKFFSTKKIPPIPKKKKILDDV
jgi:hypothetical protein